MNTKTLKSIFGEREKEESHLQAGLQEFEQCEDVVREEIAKQLGDHAEAVQELSGALRLRLFKILRVERKPEERERLLAAVCDELVARGKEWIDERNAQEPPATQKPYIRAMKLAEWSREDIEKLVEVEEI